MLYLKAAFAGLMAALLGAVLTVVVPLCVQLIRLRLHMRDSQVGAASMGFVLGFGFGIALYIVVTVCFVAGFWWVISRQP
jgi:Na+/melibiose symporter-like transporter